MDTIEAMQMTAYDLKELQARGDAFRKALRKLLRAKNDHMTACDRTMGTTHPCTCGADDARRLLKSNAQSAQNVGRETRPSQGGAAGIRSAGPADTANLSGNVQGTTFVECEYTGQRVDGKRLICELGRGHDGHHKMQRGKTAWYFQPDSCISVTEPAK